MSNLVFAGVVVVFQQLGDNVECLRDLLEVDVIPRALRLVLQVVETVKQLFVLVDLFVRFLAAFLRAAGPVVAVGAVGVGARRGAGVRRVVAGGSTALAAGFLLETGFR